MGDTNTDAGGVANWKIDKLAREMEPQAAAGAMTNARCEVAQWAADHTEAEVIDAVRTALRRAGHSGLYTDTVMKRAKNHYGIFGGGD